jgi:hypothetical protein
MPAHTVVNLHALRAPAEDAGTGVEIGAVPPGELRRVFGAPWRTIEAIKVAPGGTLGPRPLPDSELLVFVRGGEGVARLEDGDVPLAPDASLALLVGSTLHVEAGDGGLDLFVAEMGVAVEGAA